MKPLVLGTLGLMLVGCQQVDLPPEVLVTPGPVPELRESALGEKLVLSGQVENWPAGQVADIVFNWSPSGEREVAGTVAADGAFAVSTALTPGWMQDTIKVLTGPGGANTVEHCASADLVASTTKAMGTGLWTLPLIRKEDAQQALRPQLSPPVPSPALSRRAGQSAVELFYVDRDVRLVGTQWCSGQTWAGLARWQQATSVNLSLRAGWNVVTVRREELGSKAGFNGETFLSRVTIQGGDQVSGTAWTYNGVPLR